jgi:hypothetical protein
VSGWWLKFGMSKTLKKRKFVTHHIEMCIKQVAEQTFEKSHKIGRKVTVDNFSYFALNN